MVLSLNEELRNNFYILLGSRYKQLIDQKWLISYYYLAKAVYKEVCINLDLSFHIRRDYHLSICKWRVSDSHQISLYHIIK